MRRKVFVIRPKPDFSLSVSPATRVITLKVRTGSFKPYLYKGKAYRRSDTATVETDQIELRRLVLEGENLCFEQLPCGRKDLRFEALTEALQKKLGIRTLSEDSLRTLGFRTDAREYNNAGALFADENDFAGIDIVRFGESLNVILDRMKAERVSILRQYETAVDCYRKYYQYEVIEGIDRRLKELIPEQAYREAVANALVHRTWDVNAQIRISMFADRIELSSPGGLPNGMTREEYLNGYLSWLRNPAIANVFFRLGLIEMFGTGIRRIRDSYRDAGAQPSFVITDNSITVILPVLSLSPALTSDEKALLDALPPGMLLSGAEIAEKAGISRSKALRLLHSLREKNAVRLYGAWRATRYSK